MANDPIVYVVDDDDGARGSLEFLLDCTGIRVRGFASADAFIDAFDPQVTEGRTVVIDLSGAQLWDITAVAALEKVVSRYRHHGVKPRVLGLDRQARTLMRRVLREGELAADDPSL